MLMDRTFVHAKKFDSQWESMGCDGRADSNKLEEAK